MLQIFWLVDSGILRILLNWFGYERRKSSPEENNMMMKKTILWCWCPSSELTHNGLHRSMEGPPTQEDQTSKAYRLAGDSLISPAIGNVPERPPKTVVQIFADTIARHWCICKGLVDIPTEFGDNYVTVGWVALWYLRLLLWSVLVMNECWKELWEMWYQKVKVGGGDWGAIEEQLEGKVTLLDLWWPVSDLFWPVFSKFLK